MGFNKEVSVTPFSEEYEIVYEVFFESSSLAVFLLHFATSVTFLVTLYAPAITFFSPSYQPIKV